MNQPPPYHSRFAVRRKEEDFQSTQASVMSNIDPRLLASDSQPIDGTEEMSSASSPERHNDVLAGSNSPTSSAGTSEGEAGPSAARFQQFTMKRKRNETAEEKKDRYRENNRIAAQKCRDRQQQQGERLERKIDQLREENRVASEEILNFQKELFNLREFYLGLKAQHPQCALEHSFTAII